MMTSFMRFAFSGKPSKHHKEKQIDNDSIDLEYFLPQPMEDAKMMEYTTDIRIAIDHHMEFYHNQNIEPSENTENLTRDLLSQGLGNSKPPPELLAYYIVDPNTRKYALRHLIARLLLDSIKLSGDSRQTLLPPSIIATIKAMDLSDLGYDNDG